MNEWLKGTKMSRIDVNFERDVEWEYGARNYVKNLTTVLNVYYLCCSMSHLSES